MKQCCNTGGGIHGIMDLHNCFLLRSIRPIGEISQFVSFAIGAYLGVPHFFTQLYFNMNLEF